MAGIVSTRADPLTFLTARHGCSILVFTILSLAVKAAWPRDLRTWRDAMVAGMLLHGFYIGGVFWAVSQGLGAGMMGLITGLHPLFTAVLALPLLHERLNVRQQELLRSYDEGVAEFLDLERVKPNTLGNSRMLLHL